jgi:two-component system sensor histidine kinase/response regulator
MRRLERGGSLMQLTMTSTAEITKQRTEDGFSAQQQRIFRSTDRLFAWLMAAQWVVGVIAACWLSPWTWAGMSRQLHLHILAAILLGTAISLYPITLALARPGQPSTRYSIAVGQMLMSSLLIHLSGGRIETHFHIFGSLAFLAFYRDWRVLVPATVVTALDHLLRGLFWPESVYGVLTPSSWRWLEHAGWVLFEDLFLVISCRRSAEEMWRIAERQASLETLNENIEQLVMKKTAHLKASEERFRCLSASAPIGIFETNIQGNCIYTNARWQAISGLTPEESFGDGWALSILEEQRETVRTRWIAAVRDGVEYNSEFCLRTKGGELRWVEIRATALLSDSGKPTGYVGSVVDITERRQADEALRQSEERFRTIIEQMADDYWEVDLDGNLTFFNNQVLKSSQLTREELMGRNHRDYMSEESSRKVGQVFKQIYQTKEPVKRVLFEMIRRDRTKWFNESSVSLIVDSEGEPVGFRGVSRDVTERMRAEDELQQAKEAAEAANRAKSEFLANMSHEVRTPMNGILGMTELILDTEMTYEQQEYVGLIKSSADSLLVVINDILDFSKIEAGKLSLDPIEFDLHECIEETTRALAFPAHQKGLELVCYIDPSAPEATVGDATRLRQILINLVGNAIKFTQKGEVCVEVRAEAKKNDQACLHFIVRDTGIGIPVEKQTRIFEAFTQADGSTTREYGGTGLGLTIALQLVSLMKGRIWVESIVGEGSSFHFMVTLGLQRDPGKKILPSDTGILKDLPILVVDDNATNRRFLEVTLKNWGMNPILAESGPAGLAAMESARQAREPFALALLDYQMPEMDGLMMAAVITRQFQIAQTPLILLTSAGRTREFDRQQELGVTAWLSKPLKQSELLRAILTTLSNSPRLAAQTVTQSSPLPADIKRSFRILLAEDNDINQKLAVRLLEKQGHSVVVVDNGRDAVTELDKGDYDLALMDVQMPEMSGLEATLRIRARELATGTHTPIVAMTAFAMTGDRERCLEAGMDGYISKPINPAELVRVMAEATSLRKTAPSLATSKGTSDKVFDAALALELMGQDVGLMIELANLFCDEYPLLLANLKQAIALGESKAVEQIAHDVKGTTSNFGAGATAAVAKRLEDIGRQGDLREAEATYGALETAITQFAIALRGFIEEHCSDQPATASETI